MTTRKEAAAQILYVTKEMRTALGGDEEVDGWIGFLEAIAYSLDRPTYSRLIDYSETVSRKVKLRNLIDHPGTPQPEREAALAALANLREALAGDGE